MQTENLYNKFDHIRSVIATPKFLKREALGGGLPFYVVPYNPVLEIETENEILNLTAKLEQSGISVLIIDFFELSFQIIEQNIGVEQMLKVESKKSKNKFNDALKSTLNIRDRFIPLIQSKVIDAKPQLLFLKGVGKVFPFIRSHNVMNNLETALKETPTIMFFPGDYDGISLKLFGLLKNDNYYRANLL